MKTALRIALFSTLVLSPETWAADKPPAKPHVLPVRSITVRLMPAGSIAEPWKITSNTTRSCSVQVDEPARMTSAFQACLSTAPEAVGCHTLTLEDKTKVRGRILPDGSWTKTGCDQSKVKSAR